ncbi:uncharacterized protein LOC119614506 [Lucilia sericata]|uniref:uncharacterized protein LOC119614506 n=1 Tax=Lucilia sericata TaxID=13632 RepID=UPI0018A81925|nr:uncharacterized protein LOC119614506 [Lucilia sericata]
MLDRFKMLIYFIVFTFYIQNSIALDITTTTSLFTSKNLKCYKCSSLLDDDCKNETNVMQKSEFIEECAAGAQGCVKQFVIRYDGKHATFRECYYGTISSFYTNFVCEGISRNRQYDEVQCFKCKGDFCNNNNRLTISKPLIICYISMMLFISNMLSI